jgi:hypothetical protein
MATTTTNFGWDIPQSTDLVKDGATAIAALGQDIDTALVDLKGGTTGQVLSKASNTDLDYSWAASGSSKVVQIVTASTTTRTTSTSTSYADTTLTASITPTSASNKVLVFVNQSGTYKGSGNVNSGLAIKLLRDATDLITFATAQNFTGTTIELITSSASTVYLDSPATTSSTTYKTQFKSDVSGIVVAVNDGSAASTICLMEVTP